MAPAPLSTEEPPAPALVRIALSKAAAAFLTEGRVRRLIDLELPRSVKLAVEIAGPLDENGVRVFIDLPEPTYVTIQVQAPSRKVDTRRVNVSGLAWDVAARVTAIAVGESVRAQIAPLRKRPTKPREPTAAERDAAARRATSFGIEGSAVGAFLPAISGGVGGARLSVAFHHPWLSEELSLSALGGDSHLGRVRYVELGIGASHRVWLASGVRMRFGAIAGLANLGVARSAAISAAGGPESGFTARAAAKVGLDARLAPQTWLSLDLEPGAILLDAPTGSRGAWLGAALGLGFEEILPSAYQKD